MSVALKTATKPYKTPSALPAYGVADGAQSWRYGLRARERATVERALAILGSTMRNPGGVYITSLSAGKVVGAQKPNTITPSEKQ